MLLHKPTGAPCLHANSGDGVRIDRGLELHSHHAAVSVTGLSEPPCCDNYQFTWLRLRLDWACPAEPRLDMPCQARRVASACMHRYKLERLGRASRNRADVPRRSPRILIRPAFTAALSQAGRDFSEKLYEYHAMLRCRGHA